MIGKSALRCRAVVAQFVLGSSQAAAQTIRPHSEVVAGEIQHCSPQSVQDVYVYTRLIWVTVRRNSTGGRVPEVHGKTDAEEKVRLALPWQSMVGAMEARLHSTEVYSAR